MKNLSVTQCDNDLRALDAAQKLDEVVKAELAQLKDLDTNKIISKATKLLMTGNLTLEGLGLSPKLFEHIKQLDDLNAVARDKLRERVLVEREALLDASEVES